MRRTVTLGFILIAIGLISMLDAFGLFEVNMWTYIWPIFLLIPALSFHFAFFMKKANPGVLVPGGILLVLSGLFFYHNIVGWEHSAYTWPVYLFAVAFGLFELYLFGTKDSHLLIPVTVLTAVGTIFTLHNFTDVSVKMIWGILLIILGVFIMFRNKRVH